MLGIRWGNASPTCRLAYESKAAAAAAAALSGPLHGGKWLLDHCESCAGRCKIS